MVNQCIITVISRISQYQILNHIIHRSLFYIQYITFHVKIRNTIYADTITTTLDKLILNYPIFSETLNDSDDRPSSWCTALIMLTNDQTLLRTLCKHHN